jgi:hypothetical protein
LATHWNDARKNCTPIRFVISNPRALRSRANAVEGLHPNFLGNQALKKPLIIKPFSGRFDGILLAPIPSA